MSSDLFRSILSLVAALSVSFVSVHAAAQDEEAAPAAESAESAIELVEEPATVAESAAAATTEVAEEVSAAAIPENELSAPVESTASAESPPADAPEPVPDSGSGETAAGTPVGHPKGHPHGAGINLEVAGVTINGRFDLAYELVDFAPDSTDNLKNRLQNYHHFIFLSRNKEDEPFWFNIEIIDLTFYELGLKLADNHRVKFGKVLVPFGADPLYHHSYGGLSGFDQTLVPHVWAELGAVYDATIVETPTLSLDNELYFVAGISGSEDDVLALNGAGDPETVAIGDRLRFGWNQFSAALSVYGSRYADDANLYMWGLDLGASRGFLPWPYLNKLSLSLGIIRADVRSDVLGNYYHFGSYLEVDYLFPLAIGFRYRTGTITIDNHEGLFYDDRDARMTEDDTLAHSFTVWRRFHFLTLSAQYILNIEAVGETDNDVLRFTAALDF